MVSRWIAGACLAGVLVTPASVAAQAAQASPLRGKSLEELLALEVATVVGAARHEQRITEAPSSVTVVTAADIRTFGWRTLADVLRSVRGFYTTDDRNYTYLGVRGFGRPTDYNNRVLVMLDGHRLNDNIYDAAGIGTEGIVDLDLVDRIEVIRGPGSALYGTSAFFAVVNIITRRGGAVGGVELGAEAGLAQTYRARATAGWAWADRGDLLISASRLQSGGAAELYFPEFDTSESGGRVFHMDGDEATSLLVNARAGRVNLQSAFVSRTKTVPTAAWDARFGDPRLQTTDTRGWLDATYDHAIGNTLVAGRAYVDYMGYEGTYPTDGDVLNMDSGSGLWIGGEMSAARRLGRRHRVIVGIEQRFNLRQAQDNWDEPSKVVYFHDSRTSQQSALFVQDEVTLSRRWTATLGARCDWWSVGPGSLRPRAGLVYRTDRDLAVKLLYGQAFRAANMYELFYTEPSSRPNPDLVPERLTTSEIVFEQYFAGRVRVTAAGFVTRIDDLIDQATTEEVMHVNRGSAGAIGVEGEAEYRSASGVLARGSIVAQRATDRANGESLSNAPERLGTLQVAVPVSTRDVTLALDSTFVGRRLTRVGRNLDSFWLANLTATWQPRHTALMVQGGVRNLFDQKYAHPVGSEFVQDAIAQDGRTASIKLSVRF
jgi:iron complex outermembrane receptor protein